MRPEWVAEDVRRPENKMVVVIIYLGRGCRTTWVGWRTHTHMMNFIHRHRPHTVTRWLHTAQALLTYTLYTGYVCRVPSPSETVVALAPLLLAAMVQEAPAEHLSVLVIRHVSLAQFSFSPFKSRYVSRSPPIHSVQIIHPALLVELALGTIWSTTTSIGPGTKTTITHIKGRHWRERVATSSGTSACL